MRALFLCALALLGLCAAANAFHVSEDAVISAEAAGVAEAGFQGKGIQQRFGRYMWTSWDGNWLVVASGVTTRRSDAGLDTQVESGGLSYFRYNAVFANQNANPWEYKGIITPRLARDDKPARGLSVEVGSVNANNGITAKFAWEDAATCARLAGGTLDNRAPFWTDATANNNFNYQTNTGCFDWITSFAINEDGTVLAYGYSAAGVLGAQAVAFATGASQTPDGKANAGVVFVYERAANAETFAHAVTVKSNVPTDNGNCGAVGTVALYAKTLVMGCPGDDTHSIFDNTLATGASQNAAIGAGREDTTKILNVGAVDVWRKEDDNSEWELRFRILEDAKQRSSARQFGSWVGIWDDVIVVRQGAAGPNARFLAYMQDEENFLQLKVVQRLWPHANALAAQPTLEREEISFRGAALFFYSSATSTAYVYERTLSRDTCATPTGYDLPQSPAGAAGNAVANCYASNNCFLATNVRGDNGAGAGLPTSLAWNGEHIVIGNPNKDYRYRDPQLNFLQDVTSSITAANGAKLTGAIFDAGEAHYFERRFSQDSINYVDVNFMAAKLFGNADYSRTPHPTNLRVRNQADAYYVYIGRVQPNRAHYYTQCGASVAVARGIVSLGCPVRMRNAAVYPPYLGNANLIPATDTNRVLIPGVEVDPTAAGALLGVQNDGSGGLKPYNPYRSADSTDFQDVPSLSSGTPTVFADGFVAVTNLPQKADGIKFQQRTFTDASDLLFGDELAIGFGSGCLANDGDNLLVGAPLADDTGITNVGKGVLVNGLTGAITGKLCSKMPMAGMRLGGRRGGCALRGNVAAMVLEASQVERPNQNGDTDALNSQATGGAVDVFEGTTHVARVFPPSPNRDMQFGVTGVALMNFPTVTNGATTTDTILLVSASRDNHVQDQNGAVHFADPNFRGDAGSIFAYRRAVATDGTVSYPLYSTLRATDTYGLPNQYNTIGGSALQGVNAALWNTWSTTFGALVLGQRFSRNGFDASSTSSGVVVVPDPSAAASNNALFYDYSKGPGCNAPASRGHTEALPALRTDLQTCGEAKPGAAYVFACNNAGCTQAARLSPPAELIRFVQDGGTDARNQVMQKTGRSASNPFGAFGNDGSTSPYNENLNAVYGLNAAVCDNGDIVVAGKYPTFSSPNQGVLFYYTKSTTANAWTFAFDITTRDTGVTSGTALGTTYLECSGNYVHASGRDGRDVLTAHFVFEVDTTARTYTQTGRFPPPTDAAGVTSEIRVSGPRVYRGNSALNALTEISFTNINSLAVFQDRLATDLVTDGEFAGNDDPYLCATCANGVSRAFGAVERIDRAYDGTAFAQPDDTVDWPQGRGAGIAGIVIGVLVGAALLATTIYLLVQVSRIDKGLVGGK
ncbi:unnamed protein product [Pedinophyceae sp. YPF-701]|nr:unnamed protein product [Pedinophyceae sp. YPF-701]